MTPTAPDFTQQFPPLLAPVPATGTPESDDLPPVPAGLPDFLPGVNPVYWPVNPVLPGLPNTQHIPGSLPSKPETPEAPTLVNPAPDEPEPAPESEPEPDTPHSGPTVMISAKVPQSLADQLDAAWRAEGFASKHAYTVWVLTNHQRLLTATAQATNLTNKLARAAVNLHQMTQERDQLRQSLMDANTELNGLTCSNPPVPDETGPNLARLRLDAARAENDRLARAHDQAVGRVAGLEQRINEYEVMMSVLQPALDYLYGLASTASLPTTPSVLPDFFRMAFEQYIQTEAEYSNQIANPTK